MLRVYAMLGLSRTGFVLAGLLGILGASTIALDVVSKRSFYNFEDFLTTTPSYSVAGCPNVMLNNI